MLRSAALFSMSVLFFSPALAGERTVELSVPGMTCASCPYIVEAAIGGVSGVRVVTTDTDARTAQVIFDDAVTTLEAILAASEAAGYGASVIAIAPQS